MRDLDSCEFSIETLSTLLALPVAAYPLAVLLSSSEACEPLDELPCAEESGSVLVLLCLQRICRCGWGGVGEGWTIKLGEY